MSLKSLVKDNPALYRIITGAMTLLGGNHISGKNGNELILNGARLKNTTISLNGAGNTIEIMPGCKLENAVISITGCKCRIRLGENCAILGATLHLEDDHSMISIGSGTVIYEKTMLSVIEGTSVSLGCSCLLSSEIDIRTGDSHAILNKDGTRINPSQNVSLADHVWVGNRAMILKGVSIASNCVVGAGSIVTASCEEDGCAMAGNPAKIIRKEINWNVER